MFLLSQLIELASWIGGPRFAFRVELRRMQRWKTYEPEFFLLDRLVDPSRIAIDVGANEGYFAGRLSQLCCRVDCFEPIPELAETLRRKLSPSVIVHEIALSNRIGTATLRIPHGEYAEMHGSATLDERNGLDGYLGFRSISCRVDRLDDVVRQPVGFIKIDVEGHELAVLEGAEGILARDCPVVLVESEARHNYGAPANVFDFLRLHDYEGFFLEQERLVPVHLFDVAVNQRVDNLINQRNKYINNFIFMKRPFKFSIASLFSETPRGTDE